MKTKAGTGLYWYKYSGINYIVVIHTTILVLT